MVIGIFLVLLLIIVLLILIGIFIWFINYDDNGQQSNGINEACQNTNDCANGLSCQNNLCKAQIGSKCQTVSDCISGATACKDEICISQTLSSYNEPCKTANDCITDLICFNLTCKGPIDGPCDDLSDCVPGAVSCISNVCQGPKGGLNEACPCQTGLVCDPVQDICKYEQGQHCSSDCDCETGLICDCGVCSKPGYKGELCTKSGLCSNGLNCGASNLYDYDTGQVFIKLAGETIQHYSEYDGYGIVLTTDHKLLIKNGNKYNSIHCPLKLSDIFIVGRHFYGLENNKFYQGKWSTPGRSIKWQLVSWFSKPVIHYSVSHDQQYLWLQSPYQSSDNATDGYLYYYATATIGQPHLELNINMIQNVYRHYGASKMSYVDHDRSKNKATRYPRKDIINKVHQMVVKEDGSLARIDHKDRLKHHRIFNVGQRTYLLKNRICQ